MEVHRRGLVLILVGSACLATVGFIGRIRAANSVSLESGDSVMLPSAEERKGVSEDVLGKVHAICRACICGIECLRS